LYPKHIVSIQFPAASFKSVKIVSVLHLPLLKVMMIFINLLLFSICQYCATILMKPHLEGESKVLADIVKSKTGRRQCQFEKTMKFNVVFCDVVW